ncbi:uncharacterized protein DS421_12g359840 [Arachis hypogaea]|nr:uncharacterized protein DS421_12g359840 [Arachis hypogaea]
MVPNPNYMPPSMAATPPPTAQQPAFTATPTRVTDAGVPKSSHGSEAAADAPPPSPTTQLRIWPDGGTGIIIDAFIEGGNAEPRHSGSDLENHRDTVAKLTTNDSSLRVIEKLLCDGLKAKSVINDLGFTDNDIMANSSSGSFNLNVESQWSCKLKVANIPMFEGEGVKD